VAIVSVFARACVDEHPKRRVRGIRLIDRLTMLMMGPNLDATLGTTILRVGDDIDSARRRDIRGGLHGCVTACVRACVSVSVLQCCVVVASRILWRLLLSGGSLKLEE
jgi:hypothetical protein